MSEEFHWNIDQIPSPLGEMLLVTDPQGTLRALDYWEDSQHSILEYLRRLYGTDRITLTSGPLPTMIRHSLEAYWAGDLQALTVIPTKSAGTPFQQAAWAWLRTIPAGETRSYKEQARGMHHPLAIRAVGRANSKNPIGIVVPCHRVIGSNGTLTGYAGGIDRKRWLLQHEGALS
ncbi:methylated-DNA--[protein]-cysteine S-methyltransferase [Acidithiobacillus concretivorus]|uniref:Methylated-DNA--[protein]-cysteine S-methyltransferase n=1 Tax=Acidithiobacillus concretivorus TaxID=3063952 RepID=A0ABS5ZS46_9PROT|nr:methylated-DNA--[protein]-cysteine S-methyltransferase [Acidithiobacillus concretivorus]MBU2739290.1 methylated-DNA--[protein]-cysteine S-methyltransferase [Acidithiobacillus concretivorus]